MQHEAVMPVVHAQVAPVRLAIIGEFESHNVGGELLPCIEILDPDAHVAKFCDLDHCVLLIACFARWPAPFGRSMADSLWLTRYPRSMDRKFLLYAIKRV